MAIDILLSVYNGMPYLADQIRSVQAQTHPGWHLWIRDDGSSDGSVELVEQCAAEDPRIRLLSAGGERLGASRSYGWLMQQPEVAAEHVMLCDADDYWLPDKIESSVAALAAAEAASPMAPILVHTDLTVADADLRVVHPSFWTYRGLTVEPATLGRLLYRNVVTGPTVLFNRQLMELATPVPKEAVYQDWWMALVAAAFGRIVAVPTSTVLYRQHATNSVGARQAESRAAIVRKALPWDRGRSAAREQLRAAARQAAAFKERYDQALRDQDRSTVTRFSMIPSAGPVRRRWLMLALTNVPEHGILRNVGRALRG